MAQVVKNLPAVQETQEILIQSLGQEDPLEEEIAMHNQARDECMISHVIMQGSRGYHALITWLIIH